MNYPILSLLVLLTLCHIIGSETYLRRQRREKLVLRSDDDPITVTSDYGEGGNPTSNTDGSNTNSGTSTSVDTTSGQDTSSETTTTDPSSEATSDTGTDENISPPTTYDEDDDEIDGDVGSDDEEKPGFLDPEAPDVTKDKTPEEQAETQEALNNTLPVVPPTPPPPPVPEPLDDPEFNRKFRASPIRIGLAAFIISSLMFIFSLICLCTQELRATRITRVFEKRIPELFGKPAGSSGGSAPQTGGGASSSAGNPSNPPPAAPGPGGAGQSSNAPPPAAPAQSGQFSFPASAAASQSFTGALQMGQSGVLAPLPTDAKAPGAKAFELQQRKPPPAPEPPVASLSMKATESKPASAPPAAKKYVFASGVVKIIKRAKDSVIGIERESVYLRREVEILELRTGKERSIVDDATCTCMDGPAPPKSSSSGGEAKKPEQRGNLVWSHDITDVMMMRGAVPNANPSGADDALFVFDEKFQSPEARVGDIILNERIIDKLQIQSKEVLKEAPLKYNPGDQNQVLNLKTPIFKKYLARYFDIHDVVMDEKFIIIRSLADRSVLRDLRISYFQTTIDQQLSVVAPISGGVIVPTVINHTGKEVKLQGVRHKQAKPEDFFFIIEEIWYVLSEWTEPKVEVLFIEKGEKTQQQVLDRAMDRELSGTWANRIIVFLSLFFSVLMIVASITGSILLQKTAKLSFWKRNGLAAAFSLAITTAIFSAIMFLFWIAQKPARGLTFLLFGVAASGGIYALLRLFHGELPPDDVSRHG